MKLLLTGSAGFIGSYVALRLLQRGDEVVGLDNLSLGNATVNILKNYIPEDKLSL